MNITKRLHMTILSLLVGVATSCAWSVPASPGRNALARTPKTQGDMVVTSATADTVTATAADPAMETLYLTKCGRCHVAHQPTAFAAGAWPFYVHKYGPRAGLFGEERQRVLAWLQANAR